MKKGNEIMNPNLSEVIFILDRSGSMASLTNDTIGGYNAFIEEQKKDPGETKLTTVLFDHEYEILHNGVNVHDVAPMTAKDYWPRGCTALYDAIGKTINDVGHRLSNTAEDERPSKIIFVITTDGMENASREYSQRKVKEMIEHQTNKYSWQFIFLGANIDVEEVAGGIGINLDYAKSYSANSRGIGSVYSTMSKITSDYKASGVVDTASFDSLC